MTEDAFSTCHPLINLVYFVVVLVCAMCLTHPVFMAISLTVVCCYATLLYGFQKGVCEKLRILLPMTVMVMGINTLFNHYGVTVLFYLPNGNAITLEAMVYGLVMAAMLTQVILWFSCYTRVMTSDKFIYLFGRVLPALSLILSMCLRFVPCFAKQAGKINQAQKGIGQDPAEGKVLEKLKKGFANFSILTTWGLENGVDTADSMRARGYGLSGRTSFSIFRFDNRDRKILGLMTVLAICLAAGIWKGSAWVQYNPAIRIGGKNTLWMTAGTCLSYLAFCMLPVGMELYERKKWEKLRGDIEKSGEKGVRLWEY